MERSRQHGGARPGAGAPLQTIKLDKATARQLRTLTQLHPGTITPQQYVTNLIKREADAVITAIDQVSHEDAPPHK